MQYQAETIYIYIYIYCDGFHEYLRIGEFVWALVSFAKTYYQSASVECSGVIWKIHMRD